MDVGNLLKSLSPETQIVLVVCVFALAVVLLMMVFLIISSRGKTRNLSETVRELGRLHDCRPSEFTPRLRNSDNDEDDNDET